MQELLARHDLIYRHRIGRFCDGVAFGTGVMGAVCKHTADGILLQANHVDGSPQTQLSGGRFFMNSPAFRGGAETRLNLFTGEVFMRFEGGAELIFSAGAKLPYFAIKVRGAGEPVRFGLKMWRDIPHEFPHKFFSYLKSYKSWSKRNRIIGNNYWGYERGSDSGPDSPGGYEGDSSDERIFGFGFYVGTDAEILSRVEDACTIRGDGTIYLVHSCRMTPFDQEDFFTNLPSFEEVQEKNRAFWQNYWQKSMLLMHGNESDYLENMYYLSQYLLACGMSGKMPMHFITGIYKSNRDEGLNWAPAYWWYNERCLYNGMFTSGHAENVLPLLNLYLRNIEKFKEDTRKKYPDAKGFTVPETVSWCGSRYWTDGIDIVEHIHATGLEIALMMYRFFAYTQDLEWKENFVRFGRGVAEFYCSVLLEKDENGRYGIPKGRSNARESFVDIGDPVTDLAGILKVFPLLSECSGEEKYRRIAQNLVDFRVGKVPPRLLAGENEQEFSRRNADEPTLESLYPFQIWEREDPRTLYLYRNYEYRFGRNEVLKFISWDNAAIWAACLGIGDDVYRLNLENILLTQKFHNGLGTDGNCALEFNGNLISSLNFAYLQSREGVIEVFPAIPKCLPGITPMFRLAAEGGFRVVSEYDFGEQGPKFVEIESEFGGECRLKNPWAAETSVEEDGECVLLSAESILRFSTQPGKRYWIVRKGEQCEYGYFALPARGEKILTDGKHTVRLGN